MREVILKDTTFRDGLQNEEAELTNMDDFLKAIQAIDSIGVKYIEAGFPSSSRVSFERVKKACQLETRAKICAFGRTHLSDVEEILKLKEVGLRCGVLVGKTRTRDVEAGLRKNLDENLLMIEKTISLLKNEGFEVFFDAEHFFQAFLEDDKTYALEVIETAKKAGADWIVLCDTNGKMTPQKVAFVFREMKEKFPDINFGFHPHNDRGRALANAERAWLEGVSLFEGTVGGIGERVGNLDLCQFIPNLVLDFGAKGISKRELQNLRQTYLIVCDALNLPPQKNIPWVGDSAFYTEAGMHQSGLNRDPGSYWHADPSIVGNRPRVGVSDQSGKANLKAKAKEFGIFLTEKELERLAKRHKLLVEQGINFGLADASLYLFFLRELNKLPPLFKKTEFEVIERKRNKKPIEAEARVKVKLTDEEEKILVAEEKGNGPVNALDRALRKIFFQFFEWRKIKKTSLVDFKVTMVDHRGTASKVRVLLTFSDGKKTWRTVAVHENIIEAAWEALLDGYIFAVIS